MNSLCKLRSVFGAFRILRRRSYEVRQPGLAVWAEAGERAATDVQATIRDTAHRAEVRALSLADELREIVADNKVTPAEMLRLKRTPDGILRVASDCHDIGEVVS